MLSVLSLAFSTSKTYKIDITLYSDYYNNIIEVHFRKRRSNHGVLKNPSTSANTFWQIEKCSDPRSGMLI
jgi:hypothetical protein